MKLSFLKAVWLITAAALFFVLIVIAKELSGIKSQNQADFFYRMYDDFFIKNENNRALIRALGDEDTILVSNGGKFTEYDLDDYLGYFELLKNYMDEGLEPEKDIYDSYSYYIIQAYQNKEVWGYVEDLRRETKDSTYYMGTELLAKQFISANKQLSDYSSH